MSRRRNDAIAIRKNTLPLRLETLESRQAPAVFNVTNQNDSGPGSLRQAINSANGTFGADTVLVQAISGVILLTSGAIDVTDAVNIFGPGSGKLTVTSNNTSRLLTIKSGSSPYHVGVTGVTLAQGSAILGGAVAVEGNQLDLTDVALLNNKADEGGAVFLEADSRLTMINCTMSGNSANGNGGGVSASRNSVIVVNNSAITGNSTTEGNGGAFFLRTGSTLVLETCSITGNAAINGAGIAFQTDGTLTITNSTLSMNTAGLIGGGISASFAEVELVNSTISGNAAQRGGGLYLSAAYSQYGPDGGSDEEVPYYTTGPANIKNCTISGNVASALAVNGIGGGVYSRRDVNLANTIIAANSAVVDSDIHSAPAIPPAGVPDANTFFSFFSLIQNKGAADVVDQGGSIFNVVPLLGSLKNNGGPTNTVALLTGSRGIDEGDPAFPPPPNTDQRGFPRIVNSRIDIGAFEVQPAVVPPVQPPQPPQPPPTNLNAVGSGPRGDATVRVYDNSGKLLIAFQPFDSTFTGEIHVATGDINGDGVEDVVTGAGPGGGPHVQSYDGKALLSGKAERIISALGSYFAYNPGFRGGVHVAIGDVNGDGKGDIVTGAGPGGGPHVVAWDSVTGNAITSFFAYNPSFTGGVQVGAGSFLGNGAAQIVTGPGEGGGPHVRVFNNGSVIKEFFAFSASFLGGVYVAAGDVTGDGIADVVTGAGAGGGPHVKVFDGVNLNVVRSFYAYVANFAGGVRVATANLDADVNAEIIVGAGPLGGPHVRFVDNDVDNTQLASFYSIDKNFNGGVFVG